MRKPEVVSVMLIPVALDLDRVNTLIERRLVIPTFIDVSFERRASIKQIQSRFILCTIGDHVIIGAVCGVASGSNIPRGGIVVGVPGQMIRILHA
jgi:hypothetical protein